MGGDRLICANKSSCYQEITITSSSEVLSHFSVNHLHQEYPDSWLQEGTGLGVGAILPLLMSKKSTAPICGFPLASDHLKCHQYLYIKILC
jgi:phosphoribosylcarboxyaminoimidazole (NCAIR) mutase